MRGKMKIELWFIIGNIRGGQKAEVWEKKQEVSGIKA